MEASRNERAFLRYLYADDPEGLAIELKALERQVEESPSEHAWWATSNEAKANRLLDLEAGRLQRAHPGAGYAAHRAGLLRVLFAQERSTSDDAYVEALERIPHMVEYGEAWLAVANRLHAALPEVQFAVGNDDAIQEFIAPALGEAITDPQRSYSVVSAFHEWEDTVVQEPRGIRVGPEGAARAEDLRQANNLWHSWRAYTAVLAKSHPEVLDAALIDAGVLRPLNEKDAYGRPVLVRARGRDHYGRDPILHLYGAAGSVGCESPGDIVHRIVHWYDYLVANGRLEAMPPLPTPPGEAQVKLDPRLVAEVYAKQVCKRVFRALGIDRQSAADRPEPRVSMWQSGLPYIELPSWQAPRYVRGRAEYAACRRLGLLGPLQYEVSLVGVEEITRRSPQLRAELLARLDRALRHATGNLYWQTGPYRFMAQAHDEAELREDLDALDAEIREKIYEVQRTPEEERMYREHRTAPSWEPLIVPYRVVLGRSLEACEAEREATPEPVPFGWSWRETRFIAKADGTEFEIGGEE